MRALVVYESMYGNTRTVAEDVAAGLTSAGVPTEVVEVGSAPAVPAADIGLLVVGGPTHAFGMSRPSTRASAAEHGRRGVLSTGSGLREWLEALPGDAAGIAAAFDTHIDRPRLPGSAARVAGRLLRRRGYRLALPPESFFVGDAEGPLLAGERERARHWGAEVAARTIGLAGRPRVG